MLKTNSKKYKENFKAYLTECLECDDSILEFMGPNDSHIQGMVNRLYVERGYEIERSGLTACVEDWLRGMTINIDYLPEDILNAACKMLECNVDDLTEKQQNQIVDRWFIFCTQKICEMIRSKESYSNIKL